jgi:hypothetical protein
MKRPIKITAAVLYHLAQYFQRPAKDLFGDFAM